MTSGFFGLSQPFEGRAADRDGARFLMMDRTPGRHEAGSSVKDRRSIVERWREALARQVLTPAAEANSVKWKQAVLDNGDLAYTGVKAERVARSIADDLAFLAAHPMRQSKRRSAVEP